MLGEVVEPDKQVKKPLWYKTYRNISRRCNDENHKTYQYYGGRGIKRLITRRQLGILWERDGAKFMERPSIDRIDPDGNYTLENCRYIELSENCGRSRRGEKANA